MDLKRRSPEELEELVNVTVKAEAKAIEANAFAELTKAKNELLIHKIISFTVIVVCLLLCSLFVFMILDDNDRDIEISRIENCKCPKVDMNDAVR